MTKTITKSQMLGEIGETAARKKFLSMGFQFDVRGRLEAGIDAIAEVMEHGKPLARMIAVQVKATESKKYTAEDDKGFQYLLNSKDLDYWRPSNIPVIIVLYRQSDESFYWKEIPKDKNLEDRRLIFNKEQDVLDRTAVDKLANLTIPKKGFGYYVPPLGDGEEALVNMLPIILPKEIYVASTPYTGKKAASILIENNTDIRFDWVIKGGNFWSFQDPRENSCKEIVELDQVEAIDTDYLAFHEDIDEQNNFAFLLKNTLRHQTREDLIWNKERKLLYFKALQHNTPRKFHYESSQKRTSSEVVNVSMKKESEGYVDFVRHHAFIPRFELLGDQWYLIINPSYFFTTNGFTPHSYPHALLSGKKRLDNSGSIRGQVIMWHRFLTYKENAGLDLFGDEYEEKPCLEFEKPPSIILETKVPEDVWGTPKTAGYENVNQERLAV